MISILYLFLKYEDQQVNNFNDNETETDTTSRYLQLYDIP